MYKVTIDFPNLDKGKEVEIDGLGRFQNGFEYEVSEREARAFQLKHRTQRAKVNDAGQMTVEYDEGPTLEEAFKNSDSVKVKTMSATEKKKFEQAMLPDGDDEEVEA